MSKTSSKKTYDLAIAGGGLAGGLIALTLRKLRPDLKTILIESDKNFGGDHIWSFFESDITPENQWLTDPLIERSWDSYDVHFPKYSRCLHNGYRTISSIKLDARLRKKLPKNSLRNNAHIARITPVGKTREIHLENREIVTAKAVIDVRGTGDFSALDFGWQKFCGQLLQLREPHGLERPIIMDATVAQIDGYRFVYCLPFSETEIFVEDTYYADDSALDLQEISARIGTYAKSQDWDIQAILRTESGALPVLCGGDHDAFWNAPYEVEARAGARAALIQPLTSYSLPDAVRTAMMIAALPKIRQKSLDKSMRDYAAAHWKEGKFYRMLCAMMFEAAKPEKRYMTLQHFYGKDEELIKRFYAGKTSLLDQASLLSGKPPVPISKALPIMMRFR